MLSLLGLAFVQRRFAVLEVHGTDLIKIANQPGMHTVILFTGSDPDPHLLHVWMVVFEVARRLGEGLHFDASPSAQSVCRPPWNWKQTKPI